MQAVKLDPQETQDILLKHVILSRHLPQEKTRITDVGVELMNRMIENVENWAECLPMKTVELFRRIKRVSLECTKEIISEEIDDLQAGDTFAMYVRRQNCVILIHALPDADLIDEHTPNIIVATFPGSLHPSEVYAHESDVEFNYPVNAIKVKYSEMLRSEEFANQLIVLSEQLPIGGSKQRNYVSKWLLTLLSDDGSTTASSKEFPIITKKIRDETLGETHKNYFRRSSHYMCAKVLLQHSLTMQLGAETGKYLYKIVMLKFLIQMCTFYTSPDCDTFNIDLLSQMIAKMARRIEKLADLTMPDDITAEKKDEMTDFYDETIDEAKETISAIRARIDRQIQDFQNEDEEKARLDPLTDLDLETDVRQMMPTLRSYLNYRMKETPQTNISSRYKPYRRYQRNGGFTPNMSTEVYDPVYAMEFENEILYHMSWKDDQRTSDELRDGFTKYTEYIGEKYKENPMMTSRMYLVLLKIIAALDRRATINYPLLKRHRSGINSNIFASLLLPQRNDMETALTLEKYFRMRNETATHPSLIEERIASESSFSVNYAREDEDMQAVRSGILQFDDANVQNQNAKWTEGRKTVERLRKSANQLGCTFITDRDGDTQHDRRCKRCYLYREAKKVRLQEYEHLLPKKEFEQLAVVFELRIPNIIACLRDVLYVFVKLCAGKLCTLNIKKNWVECDQISDINESTSRFVTLGSTKSRRMEYIHVDEPFAKMTVHNSFSCTYHALNEAIPTTMTNNAIKTACTFKTQGEYAGLQWTLNGTTHTENQVLSRQSECPQSLSLSEFKNFGTLRADGHRLQFRKLFAMIETEALSFEKESVLSLIMQTLWECGIRETHSDFSDKQFCMAMIELLNKFIEQQKDNWMHPFKMLMATLIAVRIFEINDNEKVADTIVCLLNTVRAIVWDWIEKIEDVIQKAHNPTEASERDLRLKLIYVAITGSLTFFIFPKHKHYEKIFAIGPDLRTPQRSWLHFNILMRNNLILYEINEDKLPSILRVYLRITEIAGIHLEPKMSELIKQNEHDVFEVIKLQWHDVNYAISKSMSFFAKTPHLCTVEVFFDTAQHSTIQIDIITGVFLINGSPVSRLPLDFMQDESYQRVFGNVALEVQPNAQHRYCTVQRNNNCRYEFQKVDGHVIITERNKNGSNLEHIYYKKLKGEFPFLLVQNYGHWWNKKDQTIEFRQRVAGERFGSKVSKVDYRLDLRTNRLIDVKTQQPMLDINSDSFERIVKPLQRLEHERYIHVMVESSDVAIVDLPRMKLKFRLDCSQEDTQDGSQLHSIEFSGMHVSADQKIGTLYGLNHGLVLQNDCDDEASKTKILLMPHGTIELDCEDWNTEVDVDTKFGIRSPPFYQYQVDDTLKQLKASNSTHESWFYLAYLHAVTSHGQIEPFTGMSGTERALQILQSSFAWSSSPYEPEALEMLNLIAKLSPIRKIVESNQHIIWPDVIPSHCAQDSFVFIVKKLIEDSQRLIGLHCGTLTPNELKIDTELTLNERDYHRCLPLQPNMRVSEEFIEHKVLKTSLPETAPFSVSINTQIVSSLYHNDNYKVPSGLNLIEFLTEKPTLKGTETAECIQNILFHSVYEEFPDLWICLYDAIRMERLNDKEIALILTLFSHQEKKFGHAIYALQAVAMNQDAFKDIDPPDVKSFNVAMGRFNVEQLAILLRNQLSVPDDNANFPKLSAQNEEDCIDKLDIIVEKMTSKIAENWPCEWVNLVDDLPVNAMNTNLAVNLQLSVWCENQKLFDFIENVQERLKTLPQSGGASIPQFIQFVTAEQQNWSKYEIDFDEKILGHSNEIVEVLAERVWMLNEKDVPCSAKDWWTIIERVLNANELKHLIEAGMLPRTVPNMLLPKILVPGNDDPLKVIVGAWAVCISREQRQKRIEMYSRRPELKASMDREKKNEPHVNWKPCEHPEWLIFEIEQNLTIREIQIKVAEQMIEPPVKDGVDAKHSVMQLNMGEGKTAVIVPILAAVLANGEQACQITVLKSLFSRNLKFLRNYLGGLLDRRVYTFPCRRDMPIAQYIGSLLEIYEECKEMKGVILTLPEYRLSMQLKVYESIQKRDFEAAKNFLAVHKWLNANVRNILDESDAILQANYQLIYTVGNQLKPDGESQRWTVIQAVLKCVPYHMKNLYKEYGKDKIEFDTKYTKTKNIYGCTMIGHRTDVFTPCRIIDESIFEELKTRLVDDFLAGRMDIEFHEIDESAKKALRELLTQKTIDKKPSHLVDHFQLSEQNTIMILSGLLRFEVLKLVLTKRWRVNYGVDSNGSLRKMAIPFKAKDIAAEMTEFGHPDVAICFTQLSYYYSGLSDVQLHQLFETLENKQNAATTYQKWIRSISPKLINRSISSYSGINLDNPNQRDQLLFPLLRYNMRVIDSFLENVVYPYEAKIFEKKLMCTTWDLCSEQLEHRVTGFSGTNDTKNILPMPIAQNDLDELESTNEHVRKILLQPKNQSYKNLPANVSGQEILERLTEHNIPVLLDSGALMLELTNEQVATKWLKMTPDVNYDVAVYFDSRDVLQTIDRSGTVTEFDCSVYRENLTRCLVYLDDAHTRGTDLKFPLSWKACVTLSGDITRDKTVQSCMRMRQLGTDHSICFWASYEADIRIRKICALSADDRVTNENVISFISSNSKQLETTNMVHWTAAAINYTKKMIGHKLFSDATMDEGSMEELYAKCVDDEFVKLIDMYGDKEEALLTRIAWAKFNKIVLEHRGDKEIKNFARDMQDKVDEILTRLAPNVKQFSQALDEEQEKELEQELEEQRFIERPPAVKAAKPSFDKSLEKLILDGATHEYMRSQRSLLSLLSISASLGHTKLFRHYNKKNKDAWASHLFVTKDFKTVIDSTSQSCDEFLRPVWWIARIKGASCTVNDILVLLSSYECNRLLPVFQKSKMSTLFMYRPRLSNLHSNLLHESELQVTGMTESLAIDINDEVQIGMYAGMMYFGNEDEQNAYCGFMGLIPKPRTQELEQAFRNSVIDAKGFVPMEKRRYSEAISNCVKQCKFHDNPVDLAIKLIEAHHQTLLKESHVASIFERNTKSIIENINADE